MISLERQFQSIVLSISFGMFFMFIYSLFYRLFSKRNFFIRFPFELLLFISLTYLFYIFNIYVNEGILNIYIPLFVVIGMILYKVFYDKYIMKYFNKLIDIINKLVIDKLKLAIKNIYDIIKNKKRKWKDAKKQQSRSRKMESKQSGQYSYDWSFFNRNHGDD